MKHTITLLVLIFCFQLQAREQTALFRNYSVKDGLSQNTVIRTFEDSKGYIWFCTRDGLNRFDGSEFKVYRANDTEESLTSSDVTTIAEVEKGVLWIGSHDGLTKYDTNTKQFRRYYKGNYNLSDNCIKYVLSDAKRRLWVGTVKGLDLYNTETDDFERISDEGSIFWLMERGNGDICYLVNNNICILDPESGQTETYHFTDSEELYYVFEDLAGRLWVGMWNSGLNYLDEETGKLVKANLSWIDDTTFDNEQVNYIIETEEDNLMLATRKGLLMYDRDSNRLINHFSSTDSGGLSENTIISLFKDHSGNIWVGTYGGGVNLYTPYSNFFIPHNPSKHLGRNVGNINAIVEYDDDIWMATDEGLIIYDRHTDSYELCDLRIPASKTNREIKYIKKEGYKYLWVNIYSLGLYLFDMEERRIVRDTPVSLYNQVRQIARAENGIYWIALGVDNPVLMYNMEDDSTTDNFPVSGSEENISLINVQDVYAESEYVWIGTRVNGLYRYNIRTRRLDHFENKNGVSGCIGSNNVTCIYKDANGNLWVGTFGGGLALYDRIKETFRTFDQTAGLDNGSITSIMEDDRGCLWISTLKGISCFNPKDESFENWGYDNGYFLQETNLHSCLRSTDNVFYVGGNNLFLSFNLENLRKNVYAPPVVISKILIWPDNSGKGKTLNEIELQNNRIELKYNQSYFTIFYSAFSYVYPESNEYTYMLDGLDRDWIVANNEQRVTYTNIPPGDYVFRVRAANNDGIWNNEGASLQIKILPPFWKTWCAYLLYFIVVFTIVMLFMRYNMREAQLKMDLKVKQIEKSNMEMSHKIGVQMFTNFSHELRTPLTLIIAPLEDLLAKLYIDDELKRSLELINTNAQRLLWLVNRLMDFRKMELGKIRLRVGAYKLDEFMDGILSSFKPLADKMNIIIEYNNTGRDGSIWFDYILLEKVFFNLLSNAFRHTPKGGYVIISAKEASGEELSKIEELSDFQPYNGVSGWLMVTVENHGSFIPKEMRTKIFEVFFQLDTDSHTSIYGSGIGLNLCERIIKLHHGYIWVTSEERKSTSFSFVIPLNRELLRDDDILTKDKYVKTGQVYDQMLKIVDNYSTETGKLSAARKQHNLVIIEDNDEVRNYLCSILEDNYNISLAKDCHEGYELVVREMPDLIVSDIMTPRMDGIEFCRKVKGDMVTSHIPVILLTALVTATHIKEGYASLADDYIRSRSTRSY